MTAMMTITEVADRLGVKPETVRSYRARGLMPDPAAVYGQSPVWTPEAIEAWIASRPGQGVGGGGKRTPRTT